MGRIERGEHNPTLASIMKIIETLGIQPSEFFKDLDEVEQLMRPDQRSESDLVKPPNV